MPKIFNAKDERGRGLQPKELVLDWREGDLSNFRTAQVISTESGSNLISDWTRTLTNQPLAEPGVGVEHARVPKLTVSGVGNTGTSTRIWMPIEGTLSYNCEVKVLLMDRTPAGAGTVQSGIMLRSAVQANGFLNAYVVWHDVVFAIESNLNLDYWRENPNGSGIMIQGASEGSMGPGQDVPGLRRYVNVNFGSKIGTLVTLNVDYKHGVIAGDSLAVVTQEVDDNNVTVTAVGDNSIQYTSGTSAPNPIHNAGTGYVMNRSVMPYYVRARLIDHTLFAKGWHYGTAEPDWDEPKHAIRMITAGTPANWPSVPGYCGLYTGHMTNATHQVHFGSFEWKSLD